MGEVVPIQGSGGPPRGLSAEAKRLWGDVTRDYEIDDAAGLAVLKQACESLDHLRACQKQIKDDGMVVPGSRRGTKRPHPLLREVTEARRHILACFRALNLDLAAPE